MTSLGGLFYLAVLNHYTHVGILYVIAVARALTLAAAILIYEATVIY